MTPAQKQIIEEAINTIQYNLYHDAQLHYHNAVFKPDYPGQTPEEKYCELYRKEELLLLQQLREMMYK